MLLLINANRMQPPIAPVGIDYVGDYARAAGIEVEFFDMTLVDRPVEVLGEFLRDKSPALIGVSVRNVDDCFWPSGHSFVPEIEETIAAIRQASDAPIVLGGVGYSICADTLIGRLDATYGIRGDGEQATVELYRALQHGQSVEAVSGLLWRDAEGEIHTNRPAWPTALSVPSDRATVDNATYFRLGGQVGIETKRGCPRQCTYCADPIAKGNRSRLRTPHAIADEFESLLSQGVDVFHLCDAEFNLPYDHALEVCRELSRRRLAERSRWYGYLAVIPFDAELAREMARAGCVGINFTSDSAAPEMLRAYGHSHGADDLARVVQLCRENQIAVMLDMLLGGPGETSETLATTIEAFRRIAPDCIGAGLGMRLYPGTAMSVDVLREDHAATAAGRPSGIRRHYSGPIDLSRPTFYISPQLGERPARLVRELIGDDPRFFPPEEEILEGDPPPTAEQGDHNYNANDALVQAIAGGARGAYWDILRQLREG